MYNMQYGAFKVANQNQKAVVLDCTARNIYNRLFRGSASYDNKIKARVLILPSCVDLKPLSKSFAYKPPRSL